MKKLVSLLLFPTLLQAQDSLSGLWNAGGAAMLLPDKVDSNLFLVKTLVKANLYGGFVVTGQEYTVKFAGADTVSVPFHFTLAGTFPNDTLGKITLIAPDLIAVTSDGDTLPMTKDSTLVDGYKRWMGHILVRMAPGQIRNIVISTLSRTYLSKLRDESGSKDGNAFFFAWDDAASYWPSRTGTGQILVKLNDVSVNNVDGLRPVSGVTGDMRHLQFSYALDLPRPGDDMLVWYQGAPPDFPFTSKVLPARDTLNKLMNQFPLQEFGRPDFIALQRDDFSTRSDSAVGSTLYYVFFTLPWIFLFGFLIFLLRKPKKKKAAESSTYNDTTSSI